MLFYKATLHCNLVETENTLEAEGQNSFDSSSRRRLKATLCERNEELYDAVCHYTTLCFISEFRQENELATVYFATEKKENCIYILQAIQKTLTGDSVCADLKWQETTIYDVFRHRKTAEQKDYLSEVPDPLWENLEDNIGSYSPKFISGKEGMETIQKQSVYDSDEVLHQARNCFAGDLFREEVERIYSTNNPKKFYGIPVHYDFCFSDTDSARKLIGLLAQALLDNKRLLGRRITTISFYKADWDCRTELYWNALEELCKLANGTMILIDFTDTENDEKPRRHPMFLNASADEKNDETHNRLFRIMEKYQKKTLFVLLEKPQQHILQKYRNSGSIALPFIQFTEEINDRATALKYLTHLLEKSNLSNFVPRDWENILTDLEHYTAEDVMCDYNYWYKHALQDYIYTSYKGCLNKHETAKFTRDSYGELQNMVGLTDIKHVIDRILSDFRMRRLRYDAGLKCNNKSLHMLFTGNPGSAKTTCARLLARILKERDLLQTGEFVECGRSDLIGQYVGWTAKIVKDKFRKARGGVLFIDEAYALNSDDKFGPEAINTIVQEMENHRDDVIVIFAGYPEPMEEFLKANEGLRSRIAFHLNFPDYNAEEMTDIFSIMLKEQGYTCSTDFLDKARNLFSEAVKHTEFGNGRFARNLLEQTIMKQSARLIHLSEGTDTPAQPLHRKDLITLEADDLAVESVMNYRVEKPSIGFM